MSDGKWPDYVATFHAHHPGITERVLGDVAGSPYEWLAAPLAATSDWIVDLACGSAPTREFLPGHPWVGVDLSATELAMAAAAGRGPLLRARANALPLADGAGAAVCAAMALQVVTPLADVLTEVKRVLRPGGLLVALVPSQRMLSPLGWLRWVRVLAALGLSSLPWPNPDACDDLPSVLARHGFDIVGNDRRTFWFRLDTPAAAALLIDSLYLPDISNDRVAAAQHWLASQARPGHRLPLPLRRVVARRCPDGDRSG